MNYQIEPLQPEDWPQVRLIYAESIKTGIATFDTKPPNWKDWDSIAQTGAIARFCGKLSGLYPSKDEFAAAKVDEVIDLATDITNQMRPALKEKDPKLRLEMRRELSKTILPLWLGFLEKLLQDNGDTGFFVGHSISVADLAVWRLCAWISGEIIDGLPVNLLDGFPLLSVHQSQISNLPKVVEWIKKNH